MECSGKEEVEVSRDATQDQEMRRWRAKMCINRATRLFTRYIHSLNNWNIHVHPR